MSARNFLLCVLFVLAALPGHGHAFQERFAGFANFGGNAFCENDEGEVTPENIDEVRLAAEKGDPEAQYQLAAAYDEGIGVEENFDRAANWYAKAAGQGHAAAQNALGFAYQQGRGVGRDYAEAMQWFRKAAAQDFPSAMNNIGFMYDSGTGVPKNPIEAVRWYRKGAMLGDAVSQANLGIAYMDGEGVAEDAEEGLKWLETAAEGGSDNAMVTLAGIYLEGTSAGKDPSEAFKWYHQAAEMGNAEAQNGIGLMYMNGQGVEKDFAEGMKWFHEAAEQGYAAAHANLGLMYEEGLGVEADLREALAHYREAAEQGDEDAEAKVRELGQALGSGGAGRGDDAGDGKQSGSEPPLSVLNDWIKEIDFSYSTPPKEQEEKCRELVAKGNLFAGLALERVLFTTLSEEAAHETVDLSETNSENGSVRLLERVAGEGDPAALKLLGQVYLAPLADEPENIEKGMELLAEAARKRYDPTPERMEKWLKELDAPEEPSESAEAMEFRYWQMFENGNPFAALQLARAYRMSAGPASDEARFWGDVGFEESIPTFLLEMAGAGNSRALDLIAELYKCGVIGSDMDKDERAQMARGLVARAEETRPYPLSAVSGATLASWMDAVRPYQSSQEITDNLPALESLYAEGNLAAGLYIEAAMFYQRSPLAAEWNDRNRQNMIVPLLKKAADAGDDAAARLMKFVRVRGLGGEAAGQ